MCTSPNGIKIFERNGLIMAKKTEQKNTMTKEDYLKERVPVTLKRPESEKKEFRTVSVNGINYQIAYGKQVLVPRFVAEIIKESEKNEQIAQSNADSRAKEFAEGISTLEG